MKRTCVSLKIANLKGSFKINYMLFSFNFLKRTKLKITISIKDFEFCYQHINAANKSSKSCCWVEKNGKKCNQLAMPETKILNINGNVHDHKNESKRLEFNLQIELNSFFE